jgi:hypothetical protein
MARNLGWGILHIFNTWNVFYLMSGYYIYYSWG